MLFDISRHIRPRYNRERITNKLIHRDYHIHCSKVFQNLAVLWIMNDKLHEKKYTIIDEVWSLKGIITRQEA